MKLFRKHHLETIEFQHMDEIEASVCSIFDYYEIALKRPSNNIVCVEYLYTSKDIRFLIVFLYSLNSSITKWFPRKKCSDSFILQVTLMLLDEIEASVCSIFDYYEIALKRPSNNIDILHLQREIKTCLTLLRYVDISQSLADKLCII